MSRQSHYEILANLELPLDWSEERTKGLIEKLSGCGDCLDLNQYKNKIRIHLHAHSPELVEKAKKTLGKEGKILNFECEREYYKEGIGIVAGETADLPEELREKYQIGNVMYPATFVQEDQETPLRGGAFFKKMRQGATATTSFPPTARFQRAYQKALEKFNQILVITISSTLSKAYSSAALPALNNLSKEDQVRVYILDSVLGSAGEGLLAMKAQELISQGKEFSEIITYLEEFKKEIHVFAVLGDVKWLRAGGRISSSWARIVNLLSKLGTRPILGLVKGEIKMTGMRFFALDRTKMLLREIEKLGKKGKMKVAIVHADEPEEAKRLEEGAKKLGQDVLFVSEITPALGAHLGPGVLLISYYFKALV